MSVCLRDYVTANMTASEADRRNGNVETLQTYPQNLNLTGLLMFLLIPLCSCTCNRCQKAPCNAVQRNPLNTTTSSVYQT